MMEKQLKIEKFGKVRPLNGTPDGNSLENRTRNMLLRGARRNGVRLLVELMVADDVEKIKEKIFQKRVINAWDTRRGRRTRIVAR